MQRQKPNITYIYFAVAFFFVSPHDDDLRAAFLPPSSWQKRGQRGGGRGEGSCGEKLPFLARLTDTKLFSPPLEKEEKEGAEGQGKLAVRKKGWLGAWALSQLQRVRRPPPSTPRQVALSSPLLPTSRDEFHAVKQKNHFPEQTIVL